jgi:CheY-like chemotaxis protein
MRSGGAFLARRVLVVDDVDEVLSLVRRVLAGSGYEVDTASTLIQALAMNPGGYDAVLVDSRLGSDQGADLIEALRSEDPAAAGRCLVMTGGTISELPEGVPHITKPFLAGELLAAVRTLTDPARPAPDARGRGARIASAPASPRPGRRDAPPPAGAARVPQGWALFDAFRRLRQHDWQQLAAFVHDGPIQELTAALLELDLSRQSGAAASAQHANTLHDRVAAAASSLRWLVDGPSPWVAHAGGLDAAVEQRLAWLLPSEAEVEISGPATLRDEELLHVSDTLELMLVQILQTASVKAVRIKVGPEHELIEVEFAPDEGDPAGGVDCQAALASLAEAVQATFEEIVRDGTRAVRLGIRR